MIWCWSLMLITNVFGEEQKIMVMFNSNIDLHLHSLIILICIAVSDQYELISSPDPPKNVLAILSTSNSPATISTNRRFCISFVMENFDSGHELTLRLNNFVRNISGSQTVTECLPDATFLLQVMTTFLL